jgi:hypothetical protein
MAKILTPGNSVVAAAEGKVRAHVDPRQRQDDATLLDEPSRTRRSSR